ncbi:hypothetical protein ACFW4M_31650 [Streptomyces sp. NPDC058794]|uniref:hypothetical protein n=1 Tax=Streptomyces sp. NPDC058794 TaxID=3346636 RepID=UPI0036A0FD34
MSVTTTGAGATREYTYNKDAPTCGGFEGQRCTAEDGNGKVTSFTYDDHGNLIKVKPPARRSGNRPTPTTRWAAWRRSWPMSTRPTTGRTSPSNGSGRIRPMERATLSPGEENGRGRRPRSGRRGLSDKALPGSGTATSASTTARR